jgi:hypothetical protein
LIELPKVLVDKFRYLAQRQGIGLLQLLSEWQRRIKSEEGRLEGDEIIQLSLLESQETRNWEALKLYREVMDRIFKFLPNLLTELGPEMREDLDSGLADLVDKLMELGGGVLRLPRDVRIDFNNPRDALAELELIIRGKENKVVN